MFTITTNKNARSKQATQDTTTAKKTSNNWLYSQPDSAVTRDTTLSKTSKDLYQLLVLEARGSRQVSMTIADLAIGLTRSVYTVQRRLNELINRGVVKRYFKRTPVKRKYKTRSGQEKEHYINEASCFVLVGRFAPCYQNSEEAQPTPFDLDEKSKNETRMVSKT